MTIINPSAVSVMMMQLSFAKDYYACGMIMEARAMLRAMLSIANRDAPGLRPAIFKALNQTNKGK